MDEVTRRLHGEQLLAALEELFVDEDHEVNGGDLVQAVGMCVSNNGADFYSGLALLEELAPE